jgi:hypothetical protein
VIRWELFMPDGRVVEGRGQDAPEGMKLSELAAEAVAGRYQHPAGTTVYVAGKTDLLWTVQHVIAAGPDARAHGLPPVSKALGLTPACSACRVWMMPNGDVGIGRSVEEVAAAYRAFAQARA